jgi:diphthine-ammonia ligase
VNCTIKNRPFFSSWSGGKDACLAFYHAVQAGGKPRYLFTMLSEEGECSRSHALPIKILQQQAASLGVVLVTGAATWDSYEKVFIDQLRKFKTEGVEIGVFGDIDLEEHRKWEDDTCAAAGLDAYLPLWGRPRRELVDEMIDLGFQAVIVTVDEEKMDRQYLGRIMDRQLIDELESRGVDSCGESGEFHTVIIDGPLFRQPVDLKVRGLYAHDQYCFLNIE